MKYLLIGLGVSFGWHIGKLVYRIAEEIIFSRLHASEWYAILCKKQEKIKIPVKECGNKNIVPYKATTIEFRVS